MKGKVNFIIPKGQESKKNPQKNIYNKNKVKNITYKKIKA